MWSCLYPAWFLMPTDWCRVPSLPTQSHPTRAPLLACGTAIAHRSRRPDTAPPAVCPPALLPACHLQVTEETEEMRFNTGLAAMMEFVNGGAPSFTTI